MVNYTLAFASSLDGFIARHSNDNPFEWTSKNDQDHLKNLINQHEWQVMGRKTHELNPNDTRKRIVFSRQFKKIELIKKDIPNQFYFNPDKHQWNEFENICTTDVLILGGTKIHDFFLYADLINKIYKSYDDSVNQKYKVELNQRIQYFSAQVGGTEALEEFYG